MIEIARFTAPLSAAVEVRAFRVGDALPAETPLSDDERARAERILPPGGRRRWIAARAALRAVLADRTGTAARDLRFHVAERGKPRLAGGGPSW